MMVFKKVLMASVAVAATLCLAMAPAEAKTPAFSSYSRVAAKTLVRAPVKGALKNITVHVFDDSTASAPQPVDNAQSVDAVTADDLDAMRGEGGPTYAALSNQTLTAVTANNRISAGVVSSGAITLGPDAFSGFEGIGNFVINSGHNNTLQSSLSVNIVIAN